MEKKHLKLVIDFIMTIAIILLMNTFVTGLFLHEVIGIGLCILFIYHTIINKNWIIGIAKSFFNKELSNKVRFMYVLNILLTLDGLTILISGILISKELFTFLSLTNSEFLVKLHHSSSYMFLILVSIHLGLHLDMIVNALKRKFKINGNSVSKFISRVIAIIFILIGTKSFIDRNLIQEIISPFTSRNANNKGEVFKENSIDSGNTIAFYSTQEVSESVEDYLSKLYCTACGKHCPLSSPQCGKGEREKAVAIQNYQQDSSDSSNNSNENNQDNNNEKYSDDNNSFSNKGDFNGRKNFRENGKDRFNNEEGFQNEVKTSKEDSSKLGIILEYTSIMGLFVAGTHYIIRK